MNEFFRDLRKIKDNPKILIRALEILWMRIGFLLIPMGFLLILDNNISDIILVVMVVALFVIATESKTKKSKKLVLVILVEDYTKSSSPDFFVVSKSINYSPKEGNFMRNFVRDLKKIKEDPKRLIGALGILWMRIWFLLILMGFLLILDNNIGDIILVVMVIALFFIATESKTKKSKKFVFVILVIEEDYTKSSSSEDRYPDDYENDNFMKNVDDPFPDLDRKLGHIVDQVDDRTFHARFCETDSVVTCYLSHDLFHKNTRPLVGDLVRLEYSFGFGPRIHYIIQVINSKIKEGSPWVWNIVLAVIVGEYEETDERILYASLEPGQVVPCKVVDYLQNTFIRDGDLVLLEVDEKNWSYYKIIEIVIHYDSFGIT